MIFFLEGLPWEASSLSELESEEEEDADRARRERFLLRLDRFFRRRSSSESDDAELEDSESDEEASLCLEEHDLADLRDLSWSPSVPFSVAREMAPESDVVVGGSMLLEEEEADAAEAESLEDEAGVCCSIGVPVQ